MVKFSNKLESYVISRPWNYLILYFFKKLFVENQLLKGNDLLHLFSFFQMGCIHKKKGDLIIKHILKTNFVEDGRDNTFGIEFTFRERERRNYYILVLKMTTICLFIT